MDVYSASDGGVVQLDRGLSDWDSLEQLVVSVAGQFGIASENVLLFLDDGRELRKEVMESIWERGGMGASQSQSPRQILYLFNRDTFWSEPEKWATELQEEVEFPPPLNMMALHDLQQAEAPFAIVHDHLQHLYSLSQAQSRAVQIAYSNLFHHLSPIIAEFQTFAGRAEKELQEQERLIKSARGDMAMLPKVVIHDSFLRKRERQDAGTTADGASQDKQGENKVKTLADYVHPRKMEQVRESCRATHEDLVNRYNDLAQQMDELAANSDAERAASEEKAAEVAAEFQEGLARIEAALEQVAILVNTNPGGAAQDLMELDQAMRDDLSALTHVKNEYTLEVHIHLRKVAHFQSRITQIVQPLTVLDTELRNKGAFPHLTRLHLLPFAYVTSVVEVVQRKEFAEHLNRTASRLADALGGFLAKERGRRRQIKADTLSHLPWGTTPLDEAMSPNMDISVVTGAEALARMNLNRANLDEISRGIEELKADTDIANAAEQDTENPVEYLEAAFTTLISKMDDTSKGLDEVLREFTTKTGDQDESTIRQAEHDKALSGLHAEYQAHIRVLEERHESENAALQRRQGDLQEQLVRVRNDLGEEIMARQARSAELVERSREREEKAREYEDHFEFTAALQAELAQEKDRATDLGVRLQEALLDVDGLKNAEQTHIAQMQSLQDERSKSLQALSTAQQFGANLESQIAGLRAELAATSQQLQSARAERDTALRNQSAEAERAMRDRIAEADGDRAVLEHQNLTLTKQLEDIKVEMENKLSAVRNTATRQADGLKAELSFTKAQLRDAQRREMGLADELAMLKDSSTAMLQERSHQSDVARDAVDLARQYYETCQRVLSAINASATISGNASTTIVRPKTPQSATLSVSSKDELRESVLVRSLAQAQAFDLAAFGEAVTRTIALVKKWNKASRQYRDAAKNKISFANFTKGDLALFLPTRNAAARSWAAFNISAPHHFLKVDEEKQAQMVNREWVIARIVKTDEAVASGGESQATNPFGLADGLRYYVHHVEEFNPSLIRLSRRSTSTGHRLEPSQGSVTSPPMAQQRRESATDGLDSAITPFPPDRRRSDSGYFPPMPSVTDAQGGDNGDTEVSLQADLPPSSPSPEPEADAAPASPSTPKLSDIPLPRDTLSKGSPTSTSVPAAPNASPRAQTFIVQPPAAAAAAVGSTTAPSSMVHTRAPSRTSATSPSQHPVFAPSSLGRPASVASSASSHPHPRGLPITGASKAAPAAAVTSSHSPSGEGSSTSVSVSASVSPSTLPPLAVPDLTRRVLRKASTSSLSPSPAAAIGTGQDGMGPFRISPPRPHPSPLGPAAPASALASAPASALAPAPASAPAADADSLVGSGNGELPSASRSGTSPGGASAFSALGTAPRTLMRGFSIGRSRKSSGAGPVADRPEIDRKPSAVDMLKRFENGG